MQAFGTNKTIERLNAMLDNAEAGNPIEQGFDESKLSALETRFAQYLAANRATKTQLAEEKLKISGLIADISHQTKTPLANILLYTQLLSERALPAQDKACLCALEQQAEKLNFLVSALVKASRLETGLVTVTPKPNAVAGLLGQVFAQAQPLAAEKGVDFCGRALRYPRGF
ncbi:MAG: histidine kinase dimerization/phospho-acceptor domain-containing protein [Gemmiger sp.]|nr:histidine kinase dimerization/phospho-acceptor domain-containing protein [Gemmiger sp.]